MKNNCQHEKLKTMVKENKLFLKKPFIKISEKCVTGGMAYVVKCTNCGDLCDVHPGSGMFLASNAAPSLPFPPPPPEEMRKMMDTFSAAGIQVAQMVNK
jgi:hypothetical protein